MSVVSRLVRKVKKSHSRREVNSDRYEIAGLLGAYDGGRLSAHGRACSNAAAALRTVASAKRRPTI